MPVYPAKLPESIRNDPKRVAELKLYDYFKENLPESYSIIYSPEWICNFRRQTGDLYDPYTKARINPADHPLVESDFILLTPRGILILEVKGGSVYIEQGTWFSQDKNEVSHELENPITQARRNMFALLASLNQCRRFHGRFIPVGYAAVLPGTGAWTEGITDQKVFLFREDLQRNFVEKLEEKIGFWRKLWEDHSGECTDLSQDDFEKVVSIFAPTVELKKRPLRQSVEEFQEQVLTLTEEQFSVLKALSGNKKAIITGGAGTGKTLLAMEKARQAAAHGHKTLFTCPNRLLSEYVNRQLQGTENLEVMNFHQLCFTWAEKAGIDGLIDPDGPDRNKVPFGYYKEKLPEALLEALDVIEDKFEAVIVDEAQEMDKFYWDVLQCCMVEDKPIFYIFCDPNQAIWHLDNKLPFSGLTFHLDKNLRNSLGVFKALQNLCDDPDYDTGCTHDGEFKLLLQEDKEELIIKLEKILKKLVDKGFLKKDISIITGRSRNTSILANENSIGEFKLTGDLYDSANKVLFSSARQFRGMESMAVILVEVDYIIELEKLRQELGKRFKSKDEEELKKTARETLLIGMSRAQHSLYIIADHKTAEGLKQIGVELSP